MKTIARALFRLGLMTLMAMPAGAEETRTLVDSRPAVVGLGADASRDAAFARVTFRDTPATSAGSNAGLDLEMQGGALQERHHQLGLGGLLLLDTIPRLGLSVRYWLNEQVGAEVDVSRFSVDCPFNLCSFHVFQIAPSVLYVIREPNLKTSTQVRPLVGGGVNITRASATVGFLTIPIPETSVGVNVFAGGEVVFEALKNFGISGALGFYQTGTFGGVDVGGISLAVWGHYYVN